MSSNSNRPVSGFHRRRTTSELGRAPSGMRAISSPLLGRFGVGSTKTGWPAASGPVPASGSRPPRQVRAPGSPGSAGWSSVPGPSSLGSVTRQKPPLWSDTQVRPFGSTMAPVEMCRPPAKSEEPLCDGGPSPQPGAGAGGSAVSTV